LPIGVEADAAPARAQLGKAAQTWAAVSLADKLDTIVGLFAAGEKPTGSRDPYGLRRAAQGVMKILADFPPSAAAIGVPEMIQQAYSNYGDGRLGPRESWEGALTEFFVDRAAHLVERRGFRPDEIRAVVPHWWRRPQNALLRVQALGEARKSPDFEALAVLFKRVKNITKDFDGVPNDEVRSRLTEPAEAALLKEMEARWPSIEKALAGERYNEAMRELSAFSKPVDRFFVEVLVMAEDPAVRNARLTLLSELRRMILKIADIAEIAPDERSG
jgi:glycyl-tRNA synthetase beta chain